MKWAWFTLILLAAPPANALPRRSSVAVELEGCAGISAEEVRRIVGLELRTQVEPMDTGSARVTVTCRDEQAALRLVDSLTDKTVERTLRLDHTAAIAKPRLVALGVAELVSASWAELELDVETRTPPTGPVVAEATKAVERRRSREPTRTDVVALGAARAWGARWLSYGGGIGVSRLVFPALGWSASLRGEHGTQTTSRGDVTLGLVDGTLTAEVVRTTSAFTLRGGLGVRGGVAFACGSPTDPDRVEGRCSSGPWLGPLADAVLARRFGRLSTELRLEAGLAAIAVRALAGGSRALGADGLWFGATLGVGLAL